VVEHLHGGPDALGVPRHDFSTNSHACGPCPQALAAVQAADVALYPDPAYTVLRGQLARWHGVGAERVLIAGSASEFIFRITALAARGASRPGVRLPDHGYGDYARAAQAWGLPVVNADVQAQLLWCCEPSSPLGQDEVDLPQRVAALDAAQWLVLDCAYVPLRLQGTASLDAAARDRVWQLWTPNKALGLTGVRAAYVIAPAGAQAVVRELRELAPSWVTGGQGVALLAAWTQTDVQAWLHDSLHTLRAWKVQQVALCETLGWAVQPGVANFFCVRPGVARAEAALSFLRTQGIKLRDAASFGLPGYWRLGVLPPASQQALRQAWHTWQEVACRHAA
jgi:histidinol-phosphate aminotransferase